jgi:nucleotide-binding universal stress UspA family protein
MTPEAPSHAPGLGRVARPGARSGDPEAVIGEYVRTAGIDLLVMGAYGHSQVRRLLVGSTTSTMIRTCLVPVMLFR